MQSSAALVQQLAAGSLDLSMSSGMVDIIRAIDKGAPLALIRVRGAGAALCAAGKARDQGMKELKGKTISIGGPKDITRIFVERMLEPNGVKPGEFDMVFAGATTARAAALLGGAVDAAILLPPFNFHATAAGFNELGLTIDYAADLPFSGTVANRDWAGEERRDVLQKLLTPSRRASPGSTIRRTAPKRSRSWPAARSSRRTSRSPTTSIARAAISTTTGRISKRKLGNLVDVMQQLGDLPTPIDIDQLMLAGVTQLGD